MAVTQIHPITTTLSKALEYIENPDKTDEKLLVSGFGCSPETAYFQFNQVKKNAGKTGGTLAQHLIQSFAPGEVDYETAHRIGTELADKILKDRFQYVIATHIDKGHIHNHIIWNSVSFADNRRYHSSPNSYYFIQRTSDQLCRENGLSVIAHPREHGVSHYEHELKKKGQSWKSLLRETIDRCIIRAKDWDDFLILMEREKYQIKPGKYYSFRAEGQERFTRCKTLGSDYTEEQIRSRIAGGKHIEVEHDESVSRLIDLEKLLEGREGNTKGLENWAYNQNTQTTAKTLEYLRKHNLSYRTLTEKYESVRETYNTNRSRIKEIENRLKAIEEDIHNIDCYRKNKGVADDYEKAVFKDRFRRNHESELIIFEAAEKYLSKRFKEEKVPYIKTLRAEQKALREEKDRLYKSYDSVKAEYAELQNVKKNMDEIFGREKAQELGRRKKRSGELE